MALIFASCHSSSHEAIEPPKRDGIPEDAFWINSPEGGNWFQVVDVHEHKNNATIKVFDANTGRLIVSKEFMLVCTGFDKPIWIEDLQSQIIAFDGEKIYLKQPKGYNHCWLQ